MSKIPALLGQTIDYEAPDSWGERQAGLLDELDIVDVSTLKDCAIEECSICLSSLGGQDDEYVASHQGNNEDEQVAAGAAVLRLKCDHLYHRECLKQVVEKHKPVCPVCRKPIRLPQGTCPSGRMQIKVRRNCPCPGFSNDNGTSADTIVINYSIPSGVQNRYHYHPGQGYTGTAREAYLPNNQEGRELLVRLVFAWKHGLIFTVGTSLTTHAPNSVVWTSIHHKTSLHGGPHGFPDPGYLFNCHESLDALYVPDAQDCMTWEDTPAQAHEAPTDVKRSVPNGHGEVLRPSKRNRRSKRSVR
ncbi:hypothetical protein ACA910_002600 [Epithemia clementina (nom. ined.)]